MVRRRIPIWFAGAGATLVLLGEAGCCAEDSSRWDLSGQAWGMTVFLTTSSGLIMLWVGSAACARSLRPDSCLLIGLLALLPTVVCILGAVIGYQVINIHFWTASLVFVLPALWPVAIIFFSHSRAERSVSR